MPLLKSSASPRFDDRTRALLKGWAYMITMGCYIAQCPNERKSIFSMRAIY